MTTDEMLERIETLTAWTTPDGRRLWVATVGVGRGWQYLESKGHKTPQLAMAHAIAEAAEAAAEDEEI